jgi:hypothetical protein
MLDPQWPSGIIPPAEYHDGDRLILDELEEFFAQKHNCYALILPSGRAAISLILKVHGINRSHTVFAPKWSSACVWDVIGKYANPTIETKGADVVIAVHKYAQIKTTSEKTLVIEDSCDNLITDNATLFPNDGVAEIISLPKIMGIYSGGLLLTRDKNLFNEGAKLNREFSEFNKYQGELKYQAAIGEPDKFTTYYSLEYNNFAPDDTLLRTIKNELQSIQKNAALISQRLKENNIPETGRLPPVITGKSKTMKHLNMSDSLDTPVWKKIGIIPVHFGAP